MKRYVVGIILGVMIPLNIGLGFIPYVPRLSSTDKNDLRFYPWPQYKNYPWHMKGAKYLSDTVNIFQDKIYILASRDDPVVLEACKVCSAEIYKNFYYKIGSGPGKINEIVITTASSVPSDTVVFVFGVKGDALINNALSLVGSNSSDIPNKREGYLLRSKVVSGRLIVVGAGYDREGAFHSASTLRELIAQNTQCVVPKWITIKDYPDCEWREVAWGNTEIGCDTSNYEDKQKRLQKLDYLSLLKVNRVGHVNHRWYFWGREEKSPEYWGGGPLMDYPSCYTNRITSNHLSDFWYPRYRHRGIEPVPYIENFEEPYNHIVPRNPNCIAGTQVDMRFVVGSDNIARPIYKIPNFINPTFDNNGGDVEEGWVDNDASNTLIVADNTTYKTFPASCRILCRRGEGRWIYQWRSCNPHTFYIFKYWIKVKIYPGGVIDDETYRKNSTRIRMQVENRPSGSVRTFDMALGPQNTTKWNYNIDKDLNSWREFSLGVYSDTFSTICLEFNVKIGSASEIDSIKVWIDGDDIMNSQNSQIARLTQQQRFLIMTDKAKPKVYKNGSLIFESEYELENDSIRYYGSKGYFNSPDTNDLNWRLKDKPGGSLQSGDTIRVVYNHIGFGDFLHFVYPLKFNYAACPVEPKTAELCDTAIALTRNSLGPRYIDLRYNEPTIPSLTRDGRVKEKGWKADRLLAEDIEYNLQQVRKTPSYNGEYADICLLADGLSPYHNGYKADSIWKAIKIIRNEHPQDTAHIIPEIWGFRNPEDATVTYTWYRDTLALAVDSFNRYGYKPLFFPHGGSDLTYRRWLKALECIVNDSVINGTKGRRVKGFSWGNSKVLESNWEEASKAGVFGTMAVSMDLAWNLDPSRFVMVDGEPVGVDLCYSPETLHLHKGDIFSPVPSKFRAERVGDDMTSSIINLYWAPNVNKDIRENPKGYSYRIERWGDGGWEPFTTKAYRLDTTAIDSHPVWHTGNFPQTSQLFKYINPNVWAVSISHWAVYRISSFDTLNNQSPYNYAIAWYSYLRRVTTTTFKKISGRSCQKKVKESQNKFHIVYTGGIIDTLVFHLTFDPLDSTETPPDTLGIGMFPTEVIKVDTVGVAWLSKGMDTIYYSIGKGSQWIEPYPLISSPYPKSLSVPRMALDVKDTCHITFVMKQGSNLILFYGKFHLLNPTGVSIETVSTWIPEDPSASIEALGAGIALDYANRPHLGWVENREGKYGVRTDGGFRIMGGIHFPCDSCPTASFNPKDFPPPQKDYKYNINISSSDGETAIHYMFYAGDTIKILEDTIFIDQGIRDLSVYGSFALFEKGGDIFLSLYDAVNNRWSEPETVNFEDPESFYPQLDGIQYIDETGNIHPARFALWTQKLSDSLYNLTADVKTYENIGEYGITPYAYLKMGREQPTPFTEYRDGINSFGNEDYMKVDYGIDSLVYELPSIDTSGVQRLFVECYFDTTTPAEGWQTAILVNGIPIDSITLYPGQLTRVTKFLPKEVTGTGNLKIKLLKIRGSYVPCSRILVSQFDEVPPQMKTQRVAELMRIPKTFYLFPISPNPATKPSVIKFQVPVKAAVSLKIYDVSGRLVRSLIKAQNLEPGIYTMEWDGRSDRGLRLSTGVYFLRMETLNYTATRKVVVVK